MTFASIAFLVFLPLVWGIYWLAAGKKRVQHLVLLLASAIFYGWWDWRFLGLLATSITVDFFVGRQLARLEKPSARKAWLALSLVVNLGALLYFKYANFFIDSFITAFGLDEAGWSSLNIILPVGISFYTFQTLSYTIDVYRKSLRPADDFLAFATFVSFFPQLVAGPIERASRLLPQFDEAAQFSTIAAKHGLRQMLWGFFLKLVIADNCAQLANEAFADPTLANAPMLAVGMFAFAMQIYGDFAGYSHIAIGTARLFDITLSQNFATPFFARSIPEFWRRWHISLSTWFRDYVYIPLGGSRGSRWQTLANVWIVFLVSGLWHGAAWTFVLWGALHALYMSPSVLGLTRSFNPQQVWAKRLHVLRQRSQTFFFVALAFVAFRAPNFDTLSMYFQGLLNDSYLQLPNTESKSFLFTITMLTLLSLLLEWATRDQEYPFAKTHERLSTPVRWLTYAGLIVAIGLFMQPGGSPFIYFQF